MIAGRTASRPLGLARAALVAGLGGPIFMAVASLITALAYHGTAGEAYSPLNHWVSELGEVGVSELATVFNVGLMVGGACFVVLMAGLGWLRGGRLAVLYASIGMVSGIAGFFVGVFPMNKLDLHTIAAQSFFNLGWIAVALASFDFVRRRDRRFPRWLSWLGAATVVAFLGFLAAYYGLLGDSSLGPAAGRPAVSIVATLEWAVIIGIMAWAFGVAFSWWRTERVHGSG